MTGVPDVLRTLCRPRIELCDGTEKLSDEVRRLVFAQCAIADRVRKQHRPDLMPESDRKLLVGTACSGRCIELRQIAAQLGHVHALQLDFL